MKLLAWVFFFANIYFVATNHDNLFTWLSLLFLGFSIISMTEPEGPKDDNQN